MVVAARWVCAPAPRRISSRGPVGVVSHDRRTHDEVGGALSNQQLARGASLARHRRCRLCARRRRCRLCQSLANDATSPNARTSLDARRRAERARASHTAGARTTRSTALGRLYDSLAARRSLGVAGVGSALGVARAPNRRCDPRHVRRRQRQPRDAAGSRPLGRRVVLAARAPAAALARLSDRRSACARPLGRAPPPLWPRKRDCALPAGLCQQGSSGALGRRLKGKRPPSLGGCDASLAS